MSALLVAAALAADPLALAQRQDPLLGTWLLDRARSTFNSRIPLYGGSPPAKRVMTFEQAGDRLRHRTETTDTDNLGETYRISYTFKIDGRDYAADPQMPVAFVRFVRTDARTITRTSTYQGRVVETAVYRVSADGKTLTVRQNASNHDAAGNAVDVGSVQVFVRQ